jgi:hypothetical protein
MRSSRIRTRNKLKNNHFFAELSGIVDMSDIEIDLFPFSFEKN